MVGRPFGTDEPVDSVTPYEGFVKRQAAVRATRYLARPVTALGSSMMAVGMSPKPITYISHVRPQTAYDRKMGTGKGFQGPRTDKYGKTWEKGLGKQSPITSRHGYNTGRRGSRGRKRIRSRSLTVAGGAVYGTGKVLPIIGYAYVVGSLYHDYKSGKIQKPEDAGRQIQGYTFGMTLDEAANTGKGLMNTYRTYSPTAITARAVGTAAKTLYEVIT